MDKAQRRNTIAYIFLILIGYLIIYPLIWLFFSTFKDNFELFSGINLLPQKVSFDAYINGWQGIGQLTFGHFFINSFRLVMPTVGFTVISTALVAYGFARFDFPFKKILFMLMISTMMLPNAVVIIPRYILFNQLNWINTYLPFTMPALLACYPFFIFMQIQFIRGVPRELDEAAYIDGCNPFMTYIKVILPLMKPALISVVIFQFIWSWNDFFNNLIYITSVRKYTVPLALKMAIDSQGAVTQWNEVLAMAFVSIIPPTLLFFFAQKYFVEGISSSGIKG